MAIIPKTRFGRMFECVSRLSRRRAAACASASILAIWNGSALGLTINATYDSSITGLANAATIESAFNSVIGAFDHAISNDVSVNIGVAWGKVNTQAVPSGAIGASSDNIFGAYSYSQMKGFLAGTGDTLPASNPDVTPALPGGVNFYIPSAEAKALGIAGLNFPVYDGYIGFDTSSSFTFSGAMAAGTYDFQAVAEHELEEVLGRTTGLTTANPFYATPLDIFRYTALNTNSFVYNTPNGGTPAFASTDGGNTDLGTFNNSVTGGDRGDWQTPGNTTDAQNAAMPTGQAEGLSPSDKRLLTAIGWVFNADTGTLFSIANAPAGAAAGVGNQNPVNTPEPGTVLPFAVGGGALVLLRWRRTSLRRASLRRMRLA